MKKMILNYIVYVVYFLGMGLVSSGIVLMPFNSVRYGIILSVGLILFLTGAILNEFFLAKNEITFKGLVKLVTLSLSLAIGIGMISGGISHFKESPSYVSFLIPGGIIISSLSFIFKNGYKLGKKEFVTLLIILSFITVPLHLTLSYFAKDVKSNNGDIFNNMDNMHK